MSYDDPPDDEDWYDDDDELDEEETILCPECGEPVYAIANKCPACGYWVLDADRRATGPASIKPVWRVTAAIIIATFFAGVLVAIRQVW